MGEAIDKKEVPSFDIFVNEPKSKQRKRKKFYEREKKEAEEECKRRNIGKLKSFSVPPFSEKKSPCIFIDSVTVNIPRWKVTGGINEQDSNPEVI